MQTETAAVADATGDQRVAYANDDQRNRVARDENDRKEVVPLHGPRRPALIADVLHVLGAAAETGSRRRRRRLGGDVRTVSGRHLVGILELALLVEDRPRRHYRRRKRPYQRDHDARHFTAHVTSQAVTDRQSAILPLT